MMAAAGITAVAELPLLADMRITTMVATAADTRQFAPAETLNAPLAAVHMRYRLVPTQTVRVERVVEHHARQHRTAEEQHAVAVEHAVAEHTAAVEHTVVAERTAAANITSA